MKSIPLLLSLLASSAHGQIFADFTTTLGDFTVQLDYTNSPRTVANFITLAEGSRPWIDQATGAVRYNTPFYDDIAFHRVIEGFMIQGGSPNGLGTDGPGYAFPDETDNGIVFNAPHLIAMANSGPNTNGSQFFVTDNVVTSNHTNLNGKHTIFGSVTEGGSIVDLINETPTTNDVPDSPVVIETLSIRRVGAEAIAFDPLAQDLPIVSAPDVVFNPAGGSLDFTQPPNSTLSLRLSPDLLNWSQASRYLDSTEPAETSFNLSSLQVPSSRYFYRPSLISWPSDSAPIADLSEKTITLNDDTIGIAIINLSSSGNTITLQSLGAPTISLLNVSVSADNYGFRISGSFSPNLTQDLSDQSNPSNPTITRYWNSISFRGGYLSATSNPYSGNESGTLNRTVFIEQQGSPIQSINDPLSLKGVYTLATP